MTSYILIIDDEADIREMLSGIFEDEGYEVLKAAHSEEALALISKYKISLIVLDIWLDNSDMDGMQILKCLKKKSDIQHIPILMISGHGNVEMAVNAMKIGAFDFIEKPFKIDHILLTVKRALEQKNLQEENLQLKQQSNQDVSIDSKYQSAAMIQLMKTLNDNAESDARAIIIGESGSGKSLFTRYIHKISKRGLNTLTSLNCVNLDQEHLKATIENSDGGTIVLKHLECLSENLQGSLLKIITENNLNVRLLATAAPNIIKAVENGSFSSALYDRMAVRQYDIPSLKDRSEDIPVLVDEFIVSICRTINVQKFNVAPNVFRIFQDYHWPGNIRELKIAVEWMAMNHLRNHQNSNTANTLITEKDAEFLLNTDSQITVIPLHDHQNQFDSNIDFPGYFTSMPLKKARDCFEKLYLESIMDQCDGNIAKMAEVIDMERTALYRKLKALEVIYHNNKVDKVGSAT